MREKVIVLLSGGMDSTTLIYSIAETNTPIALSFNYGQRHLVELESAKNICSKLGVEHIILELPPFKFSNSSLTSDQPVPDGHYTDPIMAQTVVPNRNMIFLSFGASIAISKGCQKIYYAAHSGDHVIYPDCRPSFIKSMVQVLKVCHYNPLELVTPFDSITKASICHVGKFLKVPFELTWSCYKGGKIHCGICGTCIERKEAFYLNKITDPTEYMN